MKKLIAIIVALLVCCSVRAQMVPEASTNYASPELLSDYQDAHYLLSSSYYVIGAGAGVAVLGGVLYHNTSRKASELSSDTWTSLALIPGVAAVSCLELSLAAVGVLAALGGVGLNVYSRMQIKKIEEMNVSISPSVTSLPSSGGFAEGLTLSVKF